MSEDLRRRVLLDQLNGPNRVLESLDEEESEIGDLPTISRKYPYRHVSLNRPESPDHEDKFGDDSELWRDFFDHNARHVIDKNNISINLYYKLPNNLESPSIPLFICHHGAGSSALTFALLAKELYDRLEGKCAILTFDARGHGKTRPLDRNKKFPFNLDDFISDFVELSTWFYNEILTKAIPSEKLSLLLLGHSLGGSICTFSFTQFSQSIKSKILGVTMLDIVEEAAISALDNVQSFLDNTPNVFESYQKAIDWYIDNQLLRQRRSAEVSVPTLFFKTKSDKVVRITDLSMFRTYWSTWFSGLSSKFVSLPTTKLLILAGNDNLDKELIVGQMQGKYQLVVFQESGHFIQEDAPSKTALTLIDFGKEM
ncbi:hypothetical protein Kpol_1030p46, partial [Vanderwaltozyma polyspora DSM 70294]